MGRNGTYLCGSDWGEMRWVEDSVGNRVWRWRGMVLEGGVAGAQPLHKGGRLLPTAKKQGRGGNCRG